MTDIHDKATRLGLINKYMEAETTPAEERLLAEYYLAVSTVDEDERAFAELIRMERSTASVLSKEGEEEYDRIVAKASSPRRTLPLHWAAWLSGIAACVILFFTLRPSHEGAEQQGRPGMELVQNLLAVMNLPLREITSLSATPIGEYVWIKAQFADGSEETFIMQRDEETDALSLLTVSK